MYSQLKHIVLAGGRTWVFILEFDDGYGQPGVGGRYHVQIQSSGFGVAEMMVG